jgi:hypothetical protein
MRLLGLSLTTRNEMMLFSQRLGACLVAWAAISMLIACYFVPPVKDFVAWFVYFDFAFVPPILALAIARHLRA